MKKLWHYTNFKWLIIVLIISGVYLLCSILCHSSVLSKHATTTFNEVIIGIFSAAVLSSFLEVMLYTYDKIKFGFLAGTYIRKVITGINDGGLRSDAIDISTRQAREAAGNIKFITDSKYHELSYYDCINEEYIIVIDYEFAGNYTGNAEYYDHNVVGTNAYSYPKPKTTAEIILNLNNIDRVRGTGSYKYKGKDDCGSYEIMTIGTNLDILVYYKNILPSGLAEGYEIWTRKNRV